MSPLHRFACIAANRQQSGRQFHHGLLAGQPLRPAIVRRSSSSGYATRHGVSTCRAVDRLEVFDCREWIVEVMQEFPPALVLGGLAETLLAIGDSAPPHEPCVLVLHLDTPHEFVSSAQHARRARCSADTCPSRRGPAPARVTGSGEARVSSGNSGRAPGLGNEWWRPRADSNCRPRA